MIILMLKVNCEQVWHKDTRIIYGEIKILAQIRYTWYYISELCETFPFSPNGGNIL